ncbi:hypothetical protein D3C87_51950 [compost metagenome]
MQQNGSPDPDFETDDERSYFQVTLKIHPGFLPENNVSTSSEITEGANEGAKNNPATSNYPIYVDIKVIEGAIEGVSTRLKDKLGKTLRMAHKIL